MLAISAQASAQQTVSFPTTDAGIVYAHLYGAANRGVVLAHGGQFTKESWAPQAERLKNAGFKVLAIDFRGRGRSRGGSGVGAQDSVHLDVLAAVRYLRRSGAESVSVVGASFGGGAAAQASVVAQPGEIDRLVLIAHSSIDQPEQIKGRALFITARGDTTGSGALRLPSIHRQFELAPEPKELILLEGDAHAQHVFFTPSGERLMREILRFLAQP
jgi:alpha-beta hydrolase superfamily lysophospholipase